LIVDNYQLSIINYQLPMLKATVNSQTFDIQSDKAGILVNTLPFNWDMVEIKDGNFHIIYNNRCIMRRF